MIIGNILLNNVYCINETGSTGNIFIENQCEPVGAPAPEFDFSLILLILSIVEGVALIGLITLFLLRRKRKS